MSVPASRLTAAIHRFGDEFMVGATPSVGLFSLVSASAAEAFFSASDVTTHGKPVYQAIVSADDETEATDTVDWNSLSLTVMLVLPYRYRGVTIAKRLILV